MGKQLFAAFAAGLSLAAFRAEAAETFMSYNVCCCLGNYQDHPEGWEPGKIGACYTNKLDDVAEILRRSEAEWVALQEVANYNTNGVSQLDRLAEATGMHGEFAGWAKEWRNDLGGEVGVGLLSRKTPLAVRRMFMPDRPNFDNGRVLLMAEFDEYVVYVTHLGFTHPQQGIQIDMIFHELDRETKPVFLVGDMNVQPHDANFKRLASRFTVLTDGTGCTWPSISPKERLDYIFVDTKHAASVRKIRAWAGEELHASDHRPVYLALERAAPGAEKRPCAAVGWGEAESEACRTVRAALEDGQASVVKEEILPGGLMALELAIRPEPESDIRVRIELPPREKWNGELWGHGNSSLGGCFLGLARYREEGSAAVETDLGTARYVGDGDRAKQDWPEAVHRDYAWRATHLMTVYAKRAVLARYGRAQEHALFFGGSCGGRQAHSEAMRYPEDYDGIFSYTPAAIATVSSAQAFNVYRRTHDEQGNELFTTNQFRLLADAAIDFRKDRDEKPFAGRVLANPFWSDAEIDAFLDFVAAKDPALGAPDRRARLKGVYTGAVDAQGRRLCHGQLPGVMLGNPLGMSFRLAKLCSCNCKVTSADGKPMVRQYGVFSPYPSWDEFEEKAVRHCGEINASATDLAPFFAHGGKFLVSCGLEDQTTPAPENIAWYEMLAANHGGIEQLKEKCRLFVLPGVAHGGGQGRIAIAGAEDVHRDLLRQWVRKGVAPETYALAWPAQKLTIPVPPYPERAYQDDAGGWRRTRYPENAVRHPDPRYLKTDPAPDAL